jgi:hypothetical protein
MYLKGEIRDAGRRSWGRHRQQRSEHKFGTNIE